MSARPSSSNSVESYCATRKLHVPAGLVAIFESPVDPVLRAILCVPSEDIVDSRAPTMAWAEALAEQSDWPLPPNLLPLLVLDERSFACVVVSSAAGPQLEQEGAVVRWHLTLGDDREERQAALLDTDCELYVESVAEELAVRQTGLDRMLREIGPAYEVEYLDNDKRPRDFVLRPVRLACQNVIVGLAAFQHDSAIAGMSVPVWQTCEVPHVATHEGNRAMTALMLCDAFKSGGTMEIRFDRPARLKVAGTAKRSGQPVSMDVKYPGHPEMRVPASLRRYGRTVGVPVGEDTSIGDGYAAAISPSEARRLFLAVTPMPADLRARVLQAVDAGIASPERLCFTLLAQIWREIELDFMLATSPRVGSIIRGGAPWERRGDRQAESEVARAALMAGMLFRRLDGTDHAADGAAAESDGAPTPRMVEDARVGVRWQVLDEYAAVRFAGLPAVPLPWRRESDQAGHGARAPRSLVVLPRTVVTPEDENVADALRSAGEEVVFVVPQDNVQDPGPARPRTLFCPDRLAELDRAIERKLLNGRISRA